MAEPLDPDVADIMREERMATLEAIKGLPLPQQARDDVLVVCSVAQSAVNEAVARLDRAIDPRVTPNALRLLSDEFERLTRRFMAAGYMTPLQ